jgi:response regulator RpfG family c-di-GMP phosphodiesterase
MNGPLTAVLPAVPAAPAAEAADAPERYRVLAVDDEPNVLAALQRALRSRGYAVTTATGGADALARLADLQPHAIISDMRMPGMNGAEFLRASRERSPHAIRLLLTGYADVASALQAVNEGEIFRYLTKPWDDAQLGAALEQGLERHRLRAERDRLLALTARQNEALQAANRDLESRVQARTAELQQAVARSEAAHQTLKRSFMATMGMFSSLVEARAGLTRGCGRRVADHVRRVAPLLGMDAEQQQDCLFAALLVDLGKVLLPERLTHQPFAELAPDERRQWLTHPMQAHGLLMGVDALRGAAALLRSLNERVDGSGVPDRLAGEAIAIGTRLLMVAVDYESMLAGAVVRAQLDPPQAGQLLRASAGQRLDAQVVTLFLESLQKPAAAPPQRRRLAPADLAPGMQLADDLMSAEGHLLLARATVLDATLIAHLRAFEERNRTALQLIVFTGRPT